VSAANRFSARDAVTRCPLLIAFAARQLVPLLHLPPAFLPASTNSLTACKIFCGAAVHLSSLSLLSACLLPAARGVLRLCGAERACWRRLLLTPFRALLAFVHCRRGCTSSCRVWRGVRATVACVYLRLCWDGFITATAQKETDRGSPRILSLLPPLSHPLPPLPAFCILPSSRPPGRRRGSF